MKTDELVQLLAGSAGAVEPKATQRRLYGALGWGLFSATLIMAVIWGVRSDMQHAVQLPLFWFKLAVPAMAAVIAFKLVERLGRPGMRLVYWPWLLLALLLVLWGSGLLSWVSSDAAMRSALLFGSSWRECVASITALAFPLLIATLWAMKGLAPTRPGLAGAAAGLLAGAAGAAIYALHCTEMALPFLAAWYGLGMVAPAVLGYLVGRRWLRW